MDYLEMWAEEGKPQKRVQHWTLVTGEVVMTPRSERTRVGGQLPRLRRKKWWKEKAALRGTVPSGEGHCEPETISQRKMRESFSKWHSPPALTSLDRIPRTVSVGITEVPDSEEDGREWTWRDMRSLSSIFSSRSLIRCT